MLTGNFNEYITKLKRNIIQQRDFITEGYGPLTVRNKKRDRPIFEINKEIDPEGYLKYQKLAKEQNQIPSILNINLIKARCLKDKISPGYFILNVKILNRIGGDEEKFDAGEQYNKY